MINDASTDQTADRAAEAGAKVLSLPINLCAWGATQTGIRFALKAESDSVHFAFYENEPALICR
jgi:hypothetical protein